MLDVSEYIHSIPFTCPHFRTRTPNFEPEFCDSNKKVNYIMTIVSIPSRKRYSRISSGSIL